MITKTLAPICISTYSRIGHLEETVSALKKNTLAQDSELYIFSDAPKEHDEEIVERVREYAHSISGFKKVHVLERETNGRIANNRGGLKQVLDQYGRVIYLEDDIVTAPGFLQFMNDALESYEDDERILSITGYCPPINIPKEYEKDVFILQRFSGWGFATWSKKFDPFGFDLNDHGIGEFLDDKKSIKKFMENGTDMYQMLLSVYDNKIDALDVRLMYYQFKEDMFTVYPSRTLVQNAGHDGSGVNCDFNERFHHEDLWEKTGCFIFEKNIQVDERIREENYKFRYMGFKSKVIGLAKRFGIYPLIKKLKSKS